MLKANANLHQVDERGNTPLHYANDAVTVRLLLNAGADINAVNSDGETLMHICKPVNHHIHADKAILHVLLQETDVDITKKTRLDGYTPLLASLSREHVESTLLLLDFGADAT